MKLISQLASLVIFLGSISIRADDGKKFTCPTVEQMKAREPDVYETTYFDIEINGVVFTGVWPVPLALERLEGKVVKASIPKDFVQVIEDNDGRKKITCVYENKEQRGYNSKATVSFNKS